MLTSVCYRFSEFLPNVSIITTKAIIISPPAAKRDINLKTINIGKDGIKTVAIPLMACSIVLRRS